MGDGITKKIAVVLNGDSDKGSLGHVDYVTRSLAKNGFDLFILNPSKPDVEGISFYDEASIENLDRLVAGVPSDDDDDLIIVFLGHGTPRGAGLFSHNIGASMTEMRDHLRGIPHANQTVIMEQCGAGSAAFLWRDPKTLFISQNGPGEFSYGCFGGAFWQSAFYVMENGGDKNVDGHVSFEERLAFADQSCESDYQINSEPIYLQGESYSDHGLEGNGDLPTQNLYRRALPDPDIVKLPLGFKSTQVYLQGHLDDHWGIQSARVALGGMWPVLNVGGTVEIGLDSQVGLANSENFSMEPSMGISALFDAPFFAPIVLALRNGVGYPLVFGETRNKLFVQWDAFLGYFLDPYHNYAVGVSGLLQTPPPAKEGNFTAMLGVGFCFVRM